MIYYCTQSTDSTCSLSNPSGLGGKKRRKHVTITALATRSGPGCHAKQRYDAFVVGLRQGVTRLRRCISHPWCGFPSSIARQPRGYYYRTIRLQRPLGEVFTTPTLLAPALLQLWKYRPRKIGPGYTRSYTRYKVCGHKTRTQQRS